MRQPEPFSAVRASDVRYEVAYTLPMIAPLLAGRLGCGGGPGLGVHIFPPASSGFVWRGADAADKRMRCMSSVRAGAGLQDRLSK